MTMTILLLLSLLFGVCVCNTPLPVLVIDLGAESVKMAVLVHSARQFHDVALTSDGARRLDNAVAFRRNGTQRLFAAAARTAALRSPSTAYASAHLLLGAASRDDLLNNVALLLDAADLDASGSRVRIAHGNNGGDDDDERMIPTATLVAMLLEYCAQIASKHAGLAMKHALLVVPADVSSEQRRQLRAAVAIADLNLLGFVTNTQAAALAFAIDHGVTLGDDDARTVALVDIGASLASVAVARVTKSSLRILSTVTDRAVSGRAFDRRLAAVVAAKAGDANMPVTPLLLDSVARAKRVLSVNRDATIKVGDSLVVPVTRDEFDAAAAPLLDALAQLAARALREAGVAADDVQLVEIVGGGTRVPAVQAVLKREFGGRAVSYHVNSDEGALFGASYFAAHVAPYALSVIDGFVDTLGLDVALKDAPAPLSDAELSDARAELAAWRERDTLEQVTVDAKNELESFLFATKALVADEADDLRLFVPQRAVDALLQFCAQALEWLEADGSNALAVGRDEFARRLAEARAERERHVGAYEAVLRRDAALERLEAALQAVPSNANQTLFATARDVLAAQRSAAAQQRKLLARQASTSDVDAQLLSAEAIDKRAAAVQSDVEKWREKVRIAEARLKAKQASELARSWLDDVDATVRKLLRFVSRHKTELVGFLVFAGFGGPMLLTWLAPRYDAWRERRRRQQFGGHRLGVRKND